MPGKADTSTYQALVGQHHSVGGCPFKTGTAIRIMPNVLLIRVMIVKGKNPIGNVDVKSLKDIISVCSVFNLT